MVEGKLIAVVEAAEIMLFAIHVMEEMRLQVKKHMILHVDCKGALDLTYGWNISGLTKHVSVQACLFGRIERGKQNLVHVDSHEFERGGHVCQECFKMFV